MKSCKAIIPKLIIGELSSARGGLYIIQYILDESWNPYPLLLKLRKYINSFIPNESARPDPGPHHINIKIQLTFSSHDYNSTTSYLVCL